MPSLLTYPACRRQICEIMAKGLAIGLVVIDKDYRIIRWNYWMEKHSGIKEHDIIGKDIFDQFPDIRNRKKDQYLTECVTKHKSFILSSLLHHYLIPLDVVKEAESIQMYQNVKIHPFTDHGESLGAVILIEDLTEPILYENEIERLNRILKGVRNIDQLITRVTSENELMEGICNILMDYTGYGFIWIGLKGDEDSEIRHALKIRKDCDIAGVTNDWNLEAIRSGLLGRALQTGNTEIFDLMEEHFQNKQKHAIRIDCRFCCSLPIIANHRIIGALDLHSSKQVFHGEEMELLREVANDIAYAVKTLNEREKQKKSEAEKEKLQEQLRQAQKMEAIGVLAGGIAHDFNNILFSIMGFAHLISDELPEGSDSRENMEDLLMVSNRAKELVDQILTFSRQTETVQEQIYISSVVRDALQFSRSALPTTVEIRKNIRKHALPVVGNRTQIYQVVMNLCTNAYHAMEDGGGVLTVDLAEIEIQDEDPENYPGMGTGHYVKLTVEDTGSGMDKNVMVRIFDPFFTTKTRERGTGMGLSVVHGIVQSHHGHIFVHSTPGIGTKFEIFLPEVGGDPQKLGTEELENIRKYPRKGFGRLMVVDDEEKIIKMFKRILENVGYRVTAVSKSLEALEMFRKNPDRFDIVITDMTMPEMTGDRLALELMKIRPDIPVILCTGHSDQMDAEKARKIGIRKFIEKPIDRNELSELLFEMLNPQRSSVENVGQVSDSLIDIERD